MRESLFVAREKTKNSLESQQELTEYTLRKRIFDTQRARNEFEWQIIKVNRKNASEITSLMLLLISRDSSSAAFLLFRITLLPYCVLKSMSLLLSFVPLFLNMLNAKRCCCAAPTQNKNEMKILANEIEQIENALESNAKATKLAETRLENRCQRPGMELCMDEAYGGLCDEIKQLQFFQHQLNENLCISKASYNQLELSLQHLEIDLKRKQHTLSTDVRALDLRQRLRDDSSEDNTTENRQMTLTNLRQET